jgi:competence protein ComEA
VSQPNGRVPTNASPNGSLTGGAATSGASTTASTLPLIIDLNRATAQDLDKLPGVGPATAKAIIDHRTRNGPFASVDDLLKVKGIGPAKLAEIRPWVST